MAINGKINLLKYIGARKVSLGGQKGIFIPVEENPTIFVGEKGAYASVRVVEHESSFDGKTYTHFIAASIDDKKRREELEKVHGKDAMKAFTPILGNAVDYTALDNNDSYAEESEDAGDLPDDEYNPSNGYGMGIRL